MHIDTKLTRPRTRSMILAAVLGAAGLPASMSAAQFKVEYDKPAHAEHDHEHGTADNAHESERKHTEKRTITINTDDGEHVYEIRIVDGRVELAKVDGKEIGKDRVKIRGEVIVLIGEHGEVMHEFRMPRPPAPPRAPRPPRPPEPPRAPRPPRAPDAGIHLHTEGGAPQVTWFGQPDGEMPAPSRPKVMVGINLSEPSPALRKQLNLSDDRKVILVERVIEGLPADRAGLEDYDIILSIDGSEQADGQVLRRKLAEKQPGDELELVLLRGGEKKRVTIDLADYDAGALSGEGGGQDAQDRPFEFFLEFDDTGEQGQGLGRILDALRREGLDDRQIHRLESHIGEHLQQLEEGIQEARRTHRAEEMGEIGRRLRSQTHERLVDVLRDAGLSEEQIREIRQELQHALQSLQEEGHQLRARAGARFSFDLNGANNEEGWAQWSEKMQQKARDAMRETERQILELRDGRLVLRSGEELERRAAELHERLEQSMPSQEELNTRMRELDERLSKLEGRLERQSERIGNQMDRIASMFERLMERIERGGQMEDGRE